MVANSGMYQGHVKRENSDERYFQRDPYMYINTVNMYVVKSNIQKQILFTIQYDKVIKVHIYTYAHIIYTVSITYVCMYIIVYLTVVKVH